MGKVWGVTPPRYKVWGSPTRPPLQDQTPVSTACNYCTPSLSSTFSFILLMYLSGNEWGHSIRAGWDFNEYMLAVDGYVFICIHIDSFHLLLQSHMFYNQRRKYNSQIKVYIW